MVYLAVESNSLVRVESVHRLVASQIQLAFHCVNRCELYIEIFLSPEASLLAEPNGVHLTVFQFYCGLGKGFDTFKTCLEERPF